MKDDNKIAEKIAEISNDEIFIDKIEFILRMLDSLRLDYSTFGSCGIQSYFDYFFRIPNDLDIVIRESEMEKVKLYCINDNLQFIEKYGRLKVFIKKFHINIIPQSLDVISELSETVCGVIDLNGFSSHSSYQTIKLANAKRTPSLNVLSLEISLFLELFRAVNTNSILTIYCIFKQQKIDELSFGNIIKKHMHFAELIIGRLNEHIEKVGFATYLPNEDVQLVKGRISELITYIKEFTEEFKKPIDQ